MNHYKQRQPSETLLYKTIRDYWPEFKELCDQDGKGLPAYVTKEFESYLRCGQLYYGFLRRKCEDCQKEHLLPFSCKRRGSCPSCCGRRSAETTAHLIDHIIPEKPVRQWVITLPIALRFISSSNRDLQSQILKIMIDAIKAYYEKTVAGPCDSAAISFCQRFGSLLNLNLHQHIMLLDGVYVKNSHGKTIFRNAPALTEKAVAGVLTRIVDKTLNLLVTRGIIDPENNELFNENGLFDEGESLLAARAASVSNKIGLGENAGSPVRRVGKGMGCWDEEVTFTSSLCAAKNGFTIHARTKVNAKDRVGLERLISYMSRPPVANFRLTQEQNGDITYKIKRQFADGTHSIRFTH